MAMMRPNPNIRVVPSSAKEKRDCCIDISKGPACQYAEQHLNVSDREALQAAKKLEERIIGSVGARQPAEAQLVKTLAVHYEEAGIAIERHPDDPHQRQRITGDELARLFVQSLRQLAVRAQH